MLPKNQKRWTEIIAIATLRTQQEIEDMLKERTKLIYWSPTMDTTALTNILSTIVFQSYYADFMNAIRLVKNAAGNDFPNDNSGADSHYGGRSIWACISTEGKSMLKRLTRKRKEQNI